MASFFHHNVTFAKFPINDNMSKDIRFCATFSDFKLTINEEKAALIEGNFTFMRGLNAWILIDRNFTGFVSRLRIGDSFPLKKPSESRLAHSGNIRFGRCPHDPIEHYAKTDNESETDASSIYISSVIREQQQRLLLITPAIGMLSALAILAFLFVFVCYIRNRPDGVYKTNEQNDLAKRSPKKAAVGFLIAKKQVDFASIPQPEYFC